MAIRLSNARYEEIKRVVVDLFARYKVKCAPVSGFELATKMGIKVIPYSAYPEQTRELMYKRSMDGFFVEKEEGEFFIFYNDERSYGRINHAIFHEIGHIELKHTEDSELADKEVGFFAKYALVPPVLVHKLKIDNPYDIEVAFGVSLQAAFYAWDYYQKWLRHGENGYTDYELQLLHLFTTAA